MDQQVSGAGDSGNISTWPLGERPRERLLTQASNEVGALVSGDAASDTEKDAFAVHGAALSAVARKVYQSHWLGQ